MPDRYKTSFANVGITTDQGITLYIGGYNHFITYLGT